MAKSTAGFADFSFCPNACLKFRSSNAAPKADNDPDLRKVLRVTVIKKISNASKLDLVGQPRTRARALQCIGFSANLQLKRKFWSREWRKPRRAGQHCKSDWQTQRRSAAGPIFSRLRLFRLNST